VDTSYSSTSALTFTVQQINNTFDCSNSMAMADYPYETTFLGPMPGYPVSVACSRFSNSTDPIEILRSVKRGIDVYYNYTGEAGTCYNITASGPSTLEDDGGMHVYRLQIARLIMVIGYQSVKLLK
jgi:hypothetical protein